jgi:hypothetical protein
MVVVLVEVRTISPAWVLDAIAAAFLIALALLAWLTSTTLLRLYQVRIHWNESVLPLAFAGFAGLFSFLFRWIEDFHTGALEFLLVQLFLCASFVVFLARRDSAWFGFLRRALLQRQAASDNAVPLAVMKSA